MSAYYRIAGESFDRNQWRKRVLAELEDGDAGWKPLPHTGRLTEDDDWLLLVDGSVGGVAVRPLEEESEVREEVRVHPLGSVRDWELAFRILELASDIGGYVRDEEGDPHGAGAFQRAAAAEAFNVNWEKGRRSLGSEMNDQESSWVVIDCGLFGFTVGRSDLELEDEALREKLACHVRRFGSAHPATLMVLTSPDGKHEISAANYGQIATLIPEGATHITFGALGGDVIEGVVAVDDFRDVFGDLIAPAGKSWYAPAVDLAEERVILKALREKAVLADEALKKAPMPSPHPDAKPISPAEWELLESAALVFLAVAASDGKVRRKETTTFAKVIVGAAHLEAECPSLGRALGASLEKVPKVIAQIEAASDFDTAEEVRRIRETVDACLSEDEATNYKLGLLFIGREVAEASGGFFGLGRRVNEREAAALKVVADALGVEVGR